MLLMANVLDRQLNSLSMTPSLKAIINLRTAPQLLPQYDLKCLLHPTVEAHTQLFKPAGDTSVMIKKARTLCETLR